MNWIKFDKNDVTTYPDFLDSFKELLVRLADGEKIRHAIVKCCSSLSEDIIFHEYSWIGGNHEKNLVDKVTHWARIEV
jgi:hypothetical protein